MAYPDASPLGQLDQVKSQFHDLSDTLKKVCEELKIPGSPPSSDILDEMNNVITSFDDLKSNVIEWAKSIQIDIPEEQDLNSIDAITTFSKEMETHQDHIQNEKVLRDINRARSIKHITKGTAFSPLVDFRSNLDKLEKRVSTSPLSEEGKKDRAQILANEHPINDLLTLVELGNELDDEKCDQIHEIISEAYGSVFSTAAIRGSLIIPEIPDPEESQTSPSDAKSDTDESEPDKPKSESADDLPIDGQAEVQPEKIESEDITADSKEEVDLDLPAEAVSSELDFSFSASETSQSIASSLLNISDPNHESMPKVNFERGFPDLLWALIHENDLSLAYWLARHIEKKALELPFTIPSYLIETLIHGLALQNDTGSSADCPADIYTKQEFESLESEAAGYDIAYRLLMVSGALRPSLLAPVTEAHTVLKVLKSSDQKTLLNLNAFFAVVQAVEKFAKLGLSDLTDKLTVAKDAQQKQEKLDKWQTELDCLSKEAKEWSETGSGGLLRVWKIFIADGELGNLVSPVVQNKKDMYDQVKKELSNYTTSNRRRNIVRSQFNHFKDEGKIDSYWVLEDSQWTTLFRKMDEAVDFASRWVKLYDDPPPQAPYVDSYTNSYTNSIKTLLDEIQKHADTAREELSDFADQHQDFKPILAGVEMSQQALDSIIGLLDNEPQSIERNDEREWKRVLLSAELLKISNLELTEEWAPTAKALDNLGHSLVQYIALPNEDRTWEKAFEKQTKDSNHWATEHILNQMGLDQMDDDETVSKLKKERQKAITQCIKDLKEDIKTTEKEIASAASKAILTDQELSKFTEKIENIDPQNVFNFMPKRDSLAEIRDQLKLKKDKQVVKFRKRLKQLKHISEADRQRIDRVLDRGDVGMAEEYLKGEQLPDLEEDDWQDKFRDFFFPNAIKDFEKLYREERPRPADIIDRIKSGQSIGPLDMAKVPDDQRQNAAEVLATWYRLKRKKKPNIDKTILRNIGTILGWLGFEAENIAPIKGAKNKIWSPERIWLSLTATVPPSCPIPAFGSRSNGEYRLMCVWGQPGEDEILEWIEQDAGRQATFVFYFSPMTVQSRRDLAHLAKAKASCPSFLLIDENQLLFLCSERGARLPTLFDCSMPFARINPYTPIASTNVPQEMFFGREQEADFLISPSGSCFIYGGRQLGKTALLRYVERKFENESAEHKAIFIDLNSPEGSDLWPALGRGLRKKGIISGRSNARRTLTDQIKEWIDPQPGRRVLLLVDESDKFLESDANKLFYDILFLKQLMTETDGRFKLVLAGLHNVQRYSEIGNQPLAHMGAPISIGPLTPQAARDLIEKPLRTLGYRFDDPSLVAMLLFRMNFYPNLIQLFCNKFLEYLWDKDKQFSKSEKSEVPPYIISEKHIEDVYQNPELRTEIVSRFRWTLDLDERYKYLAYKIAYEICVGDGAEEEEEGFDLNWIVDEARREWSKGFSTSSADDIKGLLNEMIGLGILVKTNENERYRLRNPNVRRLLGTPEQIHDRIDKIIKSNPSSKFNPKSFRRSLTEEPDGMKSPFTSVQTADILRSENGIRLIFGSEALGIEYVFQAVKLMVEDLAGRVYLPNNADVQSSKQLQKWLQNLIGAQREGHAVPIIPLQMAGAKPENLIKWIETADDTLGRYYSKQRPIRILFVVPPEVAQIWFKVPKKTREKLTAKGGRVIKLERWDDGGLRHWLETLHIAPNSADQRKKILAATGGWPIFLENFIERWRTGTDWQQAVEKIREAQAEQKLNDDYKQKFGIAQMDRADQIWTIFCQWYKNDKKPLSVSDLRVAIELEAINMAEEELQQVIEYFNCLNLFESENADQFCPEPIVAAMTAGE